MNGPTGVAWGPGLAALGAALVVGVALLVWLRRRTPASAAPAGDLPAEWRDLLGRRDVLIQQLRELEEGAAKRTPTQLARERYALELAAAAVLMRLDERLPAASAPAAAALPGAEPAGFLATRPALRGFLWGVGSMGALGLLLFSVTEVARPRAQGQEASGTAGPMAAPERAPASPEEAELRAAVAARPEDVEARLDLARLHLQNQDLMAVWNETQAVLEKKPGYPRALAYQALVRVAMGQPETALSMLQDVLKRQPDLVEGYLHLALVQARMGRPDEADRTLAGAARRFPERAQMFTRLGQELKSAPPPPAESAGAGDPHADLPVSAAAEVGATAPASGGGVAGTVDADPALRASLQGALLFITVREAGSSGGPPVAAKRLVVSSWPVSFQLTQADSMMGQELPAQLKVEARIDRDGDPTTRDPADPKASLDGVAKGTGGLRLVLGR